MVPTIQGKHTMDSKLEKELEEMGFDTEGDQIVNGKPAKADEEDAEQKRNFDETPDEDSEDEIEENDKDDKDDKDEPDENDENDESDDLDEIDDESDDDLENRPSARKIPTSEFNRLRRELREAKKAKEELGKQIEELKSADLSKSQQDEILTAAKELLGENANEEDIQKTSKFFDTILKLTNKSHRNSNEDAELKDLLETAREVKDQRKFEDGWGNVESLIAKRYPNASKEQLSEARAALDDLWHTPEYAGLSAKNCFYDNDDVFEDILAPRKKGFETRRNYTPGAEGEPELGKMDIQKRASKLEKEAAEQDEENGWSINDPV